MENRKKLFWFVGIFAWVFVLTVLSYFTNGKSLIGVDDANIYMVYMKHFSEGHGFVYNIGGERVEGFTSLLWTLIGSVFFAIFNRSELFLLFTNVLVVSYALYRLICLMDHWFLCERIISAQSVVFLVLVGLFPGFIDWTVLSLMETGLWTALLVVFIVEIVQYNLNSNSRDFYAKVSVLGLLLLVCRPESMMWVPVLLFILLIKEYKLSQGNMKACLRVLIPAGIFILGFVVLTLWRLQYFGYPLPNTYYAKVSNDRWQNILQGSDYLLHFFKSSPIIWLIAFSLLWFFIRKEKIEEVKRRSVFILLGVMVISLMIPLITGGDHFKYYRFMQPVLSLLVVLPIVIFSRLISKTSFYFLLVGVVGLVLTSKGNILQSLLGNGSLIKHEFWIAYEGREHAQMLNTFFGDLQDLPSQGLITAGGYAYAYNGESIDLLGLNNTKMAHNSKQKNAHLPKNHASFNKEVFYQLAPDVVWLNGVFTPEREVMDMDFKGSNFSMLHYIVFDQVFKEKYGYFRVENASYELNLQIFAKRDFTESIRGSGYLVKEIDYE